MYMPPKYKSRAAQMGQWVNLCNYPQKSCVRPRQKSLVGWGIPPACIATISPFNTKFTPFLPPSIPPSLPTINEVADLAVRALDPLFANG